MRRKLLLIAVILLLILVPLAWESDQPGMQFFAAAAIAALGLVWLIARLRRPLPLLLPKFTLPLLGLLGLQIISLAWTPLPTYGLQWVILQLAALIFFLAVLDACQSPLQADFWESVVIGAALIHALVGILYIGDWYSGWQEVSGSWLSLPPYFERAPGILLVGHPNLFGGYLNLAIPLALGRVLSGGSRYRRFYWLTILAVLGLALLLTSSRGAWLGCAVAVVVTLGLYARLHRSGEESLTARLRRSLSNPRLIALAAGVLIVGALLVALLLYQVGNAAHGSVSGRLDIYRYITTQITTAPLAGKGLGALPFLMTGRDYAIGGDEAYHAHNLWLQITADSGLIGLGLALAAAALIARDVHSAWKLQTSQPEERLRLAAYSGALAATLANSLVDMHFRKLAFLLALLIILALIHRLTGRGESIALPSKATLPLGALALLAFLGTTLWFNRGLTSYWSGLESARLGDWSSAAEHLCQAAQVNQGKTFYAHQCSLAQAHAAYQHGDDPARLASAVEVERQALTIDPYWYVHWANLASYEWQLGQRQEALEHMRQAAEMAPTQPLLWLNLAWMDEQQGFAWQAARHYRTVLCRNPYYRDTLYFAASPVFQAAAELPCQPEDNLPANDSSAHQLWNAWQALQSGNLDASRQYIQRLAGLHPKNPSPYAYLARFHAASGDLSQADQALKTAFFVYEDSTLVQLAAAVLAQAHGDQASVLEHASRLFELIESSTLSKSYYLPAYLSHALPTDLSPYLKSANLTAESYQLLRDLAEELEAQGNDTRAMRLHRFLNYQSIP